MTNASHLGQGAIFLEEELRRLLKREEGQFIEFKSLFDQSDDPPRPLDRRQARDIACEYVAAFANADGGTLLMGVEDDGTPTGHSYPDDAIRDLFAAPLKRIKPEVALSTQRVVLDGKELLVFEVAMAPEAVMVEGNGFPYRVGDRVLKEPQEAINARKQIYRRVGWEQRVRSEATLADVDLDLASKFLGRTVYKGRPVEDELARYGLIQPKEVLRGTSRNVTQLGRVELPLAEAITEATRMAKDQIRRSEKLHDLSSMRCRSTPSSPGKRRWSTPSRIATTKTRRARSRSGSSMTAWR